MPLQTATASPIKHPVSAMLQSATERSQMYERECIPQRKYADSSESQEGSKNKHQARVGRTPLFRDRGSEGTARSTGRVGEKVQRKALRPRAGARGSATNNAGGHCKETPAGKDRSEQHPRKTARKAKGASGFDRTKATRNIRQTSSAWLLYGDHPMKLEQIRGD